MTDMDLCVATRFLTALLLQNTQLNLGTRTVDGSDLRQQSKIERWQMAFVQSKPSGSRNPKGRTREGMFIVVVESKDDIKIHLVRCRLRGHFRRR